MKFLRSQEAVIQSSIFSGENRMITMLLNNVFASWSCLGSGSLVGRGEGDNREKNVPCFRACQLPKPDPSTQSSLVLFVCLIVPASGRPIAHPASVNYTVFRLPSKLCTNSSHYIYCAISPKNLEVLKCYAKFSESCWLIVFYADISFSQVACLHSQPIIFNC
jgi:hypothetical protein